jgi:hypothetical protein
VTKSDRQGITSRVPETVVPEIHCSGGEVVMRGGWGDGVEVAAIITSENHLLCFPFLNRKTEVIKLNIDRIIAS